MQSSNYRKSTDDTDDNIANLIKYAIWNSSRLGFDHNGSIEVPAEIKQQYDELMAAAQFAITNIKSSGNISINTPATENLVFEKPNENGKYGPFNITYPMIEVNGNHKYVGEDFVILVNDKELSYLPKSGEDFYLTEEDGIKIGEKNTLKIKYKYNYNYSGTWTRYTAVRNVIVDVGCDNCYFWEQIAIPAVFEFDIATGKLKNLYWPFSGTVESYIYYRGIRGCKCSYDERIYSINDMVPEQKLWQDFAVVNATCLSGEEEQEIEFWPGRKIVIDLNKTDNADTALENVSFDVQLGNTDVSKTYILEADKTRTNKTTVTTDSNGKAQITIISFEDNVRVILDELQNQYYINPGTMTIDFNFRNDTWTPTIVTPTGDGKNLVSIMQGRENEFEFELNIINKLKIEDFGIIKINSSVEEETIKGITFRINLNNAMTKDGQKQVIVKTDENGEIDLGMLEVIDPRQNVTVTIEEIEVPNPDVNFKGLYKKGEATITIWHAESCSVNVTGADSDIVQADYNIEKNIITLQIENEVTIDLSGRVWQDEQRGLKPVIPPNNIQDDGEKGIPNIKVVARRLSDNETIETRTDANGDYAFIDLPASAYEKIEYVIEFTYDGINYIAVTPNVGNDDTIDSDATEIGRTAFNNKFATIVKDNAIGRDGIPTTLEYSYGATTATLQTMDGIDVKGKFAMTATTNPTVYNKNTKNIDLGLLKKEVDLAAVTDIYSATVTVNGKEKTYSYNEIISLNDNITINTDKETKYSLYLYNSDYNYRIGDYKGLGASKVNNDINPGQNEMNKTENDEINVELTYKILLNNQSATNATINQIAYYYDTSYVLAGEDPVPVTVTIDGKTYKKVILDINQLFTDTNNQIIGDITFTLAKDDQHNVQLGEKKTWVEIISYSTDTGCIDSDSAPDNILEHKTEDDTDDARGLNITINDVDRQVSGYVFEDKKTTDTSGEYNTGNGIYDNGDEKVNDVIVQLIEVKEVGNLKLEYIWQETVTGSNTVKYVTSDGKNIATYNVSNAQGEYTFKDFIPGDYIIRFIYGDGTYYDTAIDGTETKDTHKANILKYNGQDYKSTIDKFYNATKWKLDTTGQNGYQPTNSMARDNEARRLEEMAYATGVTDASLLVINDGSKLENTWMCADTSTIEIPVSDDYSQDSSDLSGGSIKQVTREINFGLVQRPQASLTLEKHLTHLNISGPGITIDGTADIANYSSDELLKLRENGILASDTNKADNRRGEWIVEAPTAADLQGADVTIEYEYVIKNIGDADYIGSALKAKLSSATSTVSDVYSAVAEEIKGAIYNTTGYTIGRYLGAAYYNGDTNGVVTYAGSQSTNIPSGISVKVEDYTRYNKRISCYWRKF